MKNKELKYNDKNQLIEFIEFDNGEIIAQYKAEKNKLFRISYDIEEDGSMSTKKSIIEFEENIFLNYLEINNYYVIKARSTNSTSPKIKSRIDLSKEGYINSFTIKGDLIDSWLDL